MAFIKGVKVTLIQGWGELLQETQEMGLYCLQCPLDLSGLKFPSQPGVGAEPLFCGWALRDGFIC